MLERILVATDFSAGSLAAIGYAVFLGQRLGAELEVLHVVEPAEGLDVSTKVVGEGGAEQTYGQLVRAKAEESMKRFLTSLPFSQGVRIRSRIEIGKSADLTIDIANREAFDLIVMGTRGRTGPEAGVVGSVAEKVIRAAKCPVMTVRVPDVTKK